MESTNKFNKKPKNTTAAKTTEATIETYLRQQVQGMGGRAYKFVSPGNVGVPDRVVVLPYGRICFVELKAPGKKSTPMQTLQQNRLIALGGKVYCDIDSKDKVDRLLYEMTAGLSPWLESAT